MSTGFWSFFKQEWRRVFTHSDIRSMALAAPVLYGVLLCFAYLHGRVQNVPVGVVSEDHSTFAKEMVRQIDATEEVHIIGSYVDLHEAAEAMSRGETSATLYILRDFTKQRLRLQQSPIFLAANTSNFAVSSPPLIATSTVTQIYGAGTLLAVLRKNGLPAGKATVMANPVALDTRPIFNPQLNYSFFFVPGLIFAILQQIIIIGLCFSLTDQKDQSSWQPERRKGLTLSYILGRSLPYILINLGFSAAYVYLLLPMIHIPAQLEQVPLFLALCLFFTVAASFMGFLFGLLFKDSVTAFVALMFYSMPAFLLSGMSWPSYNLSWPLKVLSWLTPITHFGDAVRRILLEPQVDFRHVAPAFLALTVFALISLLLSYLLLRSSEVKDRAEMRTSDL